MNPMTAPAREQAAVPEFIRKGECRYRNDQTPAVFLPLKGGNIVTYLPSGVYRMHDSKGREIPGSYPNSEWDLIPLAPEREGSEPLARAEELLSFYESHGEPEFPGAEPTIRVNAKDFAEILTCVRSADTPPAPPVATVYEDGWVYFKRDGVTWRTNEFCKSEHWHVPTSKWGFAGLYSARDIAAKGWKQVYPKPFDVVSELENELGGKPADQAEGAVREWDVEQLLGLIAHADLHSAYKRCGYDKMTRKQQELWDAARKEYFGLQDEEPFREVAGAGVAESDGWRYFKFDSGAIWRARAELASEWKHHGSDWRASTQPFKLGDFLHDVANGKAVEVTATGTPLA